MSKQKQAINKVAAKTESIKSKGFDLVINNTQALLITLGVALVSYIFSFFYTSFYQGEEGAQYMNALGFWKYPNSILGNWPKTGWKLIYAPVVLFGKQGVLIANCLFSAFTGFFAYKLYQKITGKQSALPIILLATQTLWFMLSFKFYSEIPTAFLLTVALYFYYSNKYILFALFASYVLLLRQEFVFIYPYFAFVLLKRKQWIAFFALGLFPVLYNVWGWQVTGDILYSLHESQKTAAEYKKSYPRQGFDHYPMMSAVIFSMVSVTLVVTYLAQAITKQLQKIEWALLIPALGFVFIHSLFNLQSYEILTSTGGNLRYLLVISPLIAVLATLALKEMPTIKNKYLLLIILIPFLGFVMGNMTFSHNWILMDKENVDRDRLPVLFCIAVIGLLLFVQNILLRNRLVALLCILTVLVYIRPKELCCDENFEQKKIVEYIQENKLDNKPLIQNLALFNYFYDKNAWEFKNGNAGMYGDSSLNKAPVGSIIIWDSHYATKYGKVEISYFEKNFAKYKMLKQFRAEDNTFAAIVFEKIAL
ncbi:MAG: hypothetical protein ACOVMI_02555 [Chitinophagaceae bacterium]